MKTACCLQSVARIVLTDENGTLAEQLDAPIALICSVPALTPTRSAVRDSPEPLARAELIFHNGLGGFTPDGREYVITLQPEQMTPAPWVNVLANPSFGTVISESGSAYTWVENSHEFRLTPWNNDPVTDATGEAFYIRDEQTRTILVAHTVARARRDALRHPSWLRLHRVRTHRERHRLRVDGLCGHGRAGEIRGLEIAQRLGASAPAVRHRLLGMGAGRPAPKELAACANRSGPQDRRVAGAQFLQHRICRTHRLRRCRRSDAHLHGRSERVSRPERKSVESGGPEAGAPFRQSRGGAGSLRRGASHL